MTQYAYDLSETELNQQIDTMLASNDAMQSALVSDNPLLRAAAQLATNNHPVLPGALRQTIKHQTVDAIPETKILRSIQFSSWLTRVAALFIITILVGLSAVPASANSLPGEVLYPVKLGIEELGLAFANSPTMQVDIHLNHAERRLYESEQIGATSPHFIPTLERAQRSLTKASDIANDNALLEQASAVSEHMLSLTIHFDQIVAGAPIPEEVANNLQTGITELRESLPVTTLDNEQTPIEITPEATPEVTLPPETTDNTATTTEILFVQSNGAVNVRGGAGTNFEIVASANQNVPLTVIGRSDAGDWVQVQLPNGTIGWIVAFLLDDAPGQSNGNANGNRTGNANGNANGNSSGNRTGNANGN